MVSSTSGGKSPYQEKEVLLESLLRGFVVLGILTAVLILWRSFTYDHKPSDIIQLLILTFYIILAANRRKIDSGIIVGITLILLLSLAFVGLLYRGLASQSPIVITVALIVAGVYYGRAGVVLTALLSGSAYALIAAMYIKGSIHAGVDHSAYSGSGVGWSMELTGICALAGYVAFHLSENSRIMRERFRTLYERNLELEREAGTRERIIENRELVFREKEALVDEVHHRVKNNLHVISTLMQYQARSIGDDTEAQDILTDARLRISSFSILYREILHGFSGAEVPFSNYVEEVALSLSSAHGIPVRIEVFTDDSTICLDTALPCGLVAYEALYNMILSIRRSPSNNEVIRIEFFKKPSGLFEFTISRSGKETVPEREDLPSEMSLDTIKQVCRSLSADFQFSRADVMRFSMTFKEYFEAGSTLF